MRVSIIHINYKKRLKKSFNKPPRSFNMYELNELYLMIQ